MIIPSSTTSTKTFTSTPTQSVSLTSVECDVVKSFAATPSSTLTINAPTGKTITTILSGYASMTSPMTIVQEVGVWYVKFDASLYYWVVLNDGTNQVLSTSITVKGNLGTTLTSATIPSPAPTLTASAGVIGGAGAYVDGTITVGAFTCTAIEKMHVQVIIDPDNP